MTKPRVARAVAAIATAIVANNAAAQGMPPWTASGAPLPEGVKSVEIVRKDEPLFTAPDAKSPRRGAAALGAASSCVSDRPDSSGPVDTSGEPVAIESFAYGPPELTVTVGSAVVWTNRDPVVHTVTADDGSFDSSVLSQGEVFRLVPDHAGTFPYFCSVHPFMRGTLNVAP